MGDVTTASSISSSSIASVVAPALVAAGALAGAAPTTAAVSGEIGEGAAATAGSVGAGSVNTGVVPCLRTRIFRPSCSSSNSASSCSRIRSRICLMTSTFIIRVPYQPSIIVQCVLRFGVLCRTGSLLHRDFAPATRRVGQQLATLRRDEHVVFDAYAADAFHVRARLDREHHPRIEPRLAGIVGGSLRQAWRFVDF